MALLRSIGLFMFFRGSNKNRQGGMYHAAKNWGGNLVQIVLYSLDCPFSSPHVSEMCDSRLSYVKYLVLKCSNWPATLHAIHLAYSESGFCVACVAHKQLVLFAFCSSFSCLADNTFISLLTHRNYHTQSLPWKRARRITNSSFRALLHCSRSGSDHLSVQWHSSGWDLCQ